LAERIELFRASGRIFRQSDELFTEAGWLQVMAGQGIEPRACHPLAEQLSPEDLTGFLSTLERLVASNAAALPSHARFVAEHCKAGLN
jgi:tryptophan halogenase